LTSCRAGSGAALAGYVALVLATQTGLARDLAPGLAGDLAPGLTRDLATRLAGITTLARELAAGLAGSVTSSARNINRDIYKFRLRPEPDQNAVYMNGYKNVAGHGAAGHRDRYDN